MVKIYGDVSDAEQDFFEAVNSRFKIINSDQITTFSKASIKLQTNLLKGKRFIDKLFKKIS